MEHCAKNVRFCYFSHSVLLSLLLPDHKITIVKKRKEHFLSFLTQESVHIVEKFKFKVVFPRKFGTFTIIWHLNENIWKLPKTISHLPVTTSHLPVTTSHHPETIAHLPKTIWHLPHSGASRTHTLCVCVALL